ncbi:MAG: hypothetical protein ABL906_11555 [Sideroxydans sp.]
MSIKKWVAMAGVVLGLASASTYAEEAAIQPPTLKVTPWLMTGKANSFRSCAGTCSTSPAFDLHVYWSSNQPWFSQADTSFEVRTMLGLGLTSYSAKLNGVGANVEGQSMKVGVEMRHKKLADLALVVHGDLLGMTRVTGGNLPRQVDFANDGDVGLTYDITQNAHLYAGYTFRSIPQSINNVASGGWALGFGWTPKHRSVME